MTERNGSYPAPPYWPDRLTHSKPVWRVPSDFLFAIWESDRIAQCYIMDGYPGPCVMIYDNGAFTEWFPFITVERAETKGLALT